MRHDTSFIDNQNQDIEPIKTLSIKDIELIQSYFKQIMKIKREHQSLYNSDGSGYDFSLDLAKKPAITGNKKLNSIVTFMAKKMPSVRINYPEPIKTLKISELDYLYLYLEKVKNYVKKQASQQLNSPTRQQSIFQPIPKNRATDIYDPIKREVPIDWRTFSVPDESQQNFHSGFSSHGPFFDNQEPGVRGSVCTRPPKKSQQSMEIGYTNDYYNPYEYGSGQKSMGMLYKKPFDGPYDNSGISSDQLGLSQNMYDEKFPGHIRNVNIESSLLQHEITKIPGQRTLTQQDFDRWNLLPFNPQDPKHIVWKDNMPRGGYPTRNDRLEL